MQADPVLTERAASVHEAGACVQDAARASDLTLSHPRALTVPVGAFAFLKEVNDV